PVEAIRVKSLMVPPGIPDWFTRQRMVESGPVALEGRAWSGNGVPVTKVELGIDDKWAEAELDAPTGAYAWTRWHFNWDAKPGRYTLSCRATDANDDTQPVEPRWDNSGMGNNYVQQVLVTVR
ncbi:MAG: sulfite oxidase, partial [Hyphomicrobiales bacterium]